jgi:pyruvate kinase
VGGLLTSHKGVNLPGVALQIPAMTDKDREDALLALELKLDYVALSFVRRAKDIEELRDYLERHAHVPKKRRVGENPNWIPAIVAKIEKPEAFDDLEAIVRAADAIMVARGDLGVETAPERVPLAQKEIIRLCNALGKPVITATQMLQSMIEAPRPTRAEPRRGQRPYRRSDAVMLSVRPRWQVPGGSRQMMAKIPSREHSDPPLRTAHGQVCGEGVLPPRRSDLPRDHRAP